MEKNYEGTLKYKIGSILSDLPPAARLQKKQLIKKMCHINSGTLSRWLNCTTHDTQDIGGANLIIIAHLLNVTVDDLINQDARIELIKHTAVKQQKV